MSGITPLPTSLGGPMTRRTVRVGHRNLDELGYPRCSRSRVPGLGFRTWNVELGPRRAVTITRPALGVNLIALLSRLKRSLAVVRRA